MWFPILQLGLVDSDKIAPSAVSDECIKLPNLGADTDIVFYDYDDRFATLGERTLSDNLHSATQSNLDVLDLYQDILEDCSFVSSLISIAEMGMSSNLEQLVTFFDNSSAKVRLLANGTWREISISTKLPFVQGKNSERSLFVRCLSKRFLIWPAILEKAYLLTSNEHYNHTGSNMANDTYMLTGWLPEVRKISQTSVHHIEELWNLKLRGLIMIGLGTGPMSTELSRNIGLIPNHDYVLSGFSSKSESLTLTNPWAMNNDHAGQRSVVIDNSILFQFSYFYVNWKPTSQSKSQICFVCPASYWTKDYLGDRPQFEIKNTTTQKQKIIILTEQFLTCESEFCVSVWQAENLLYTTGEHLCVAGGRFVNSKHSLITLEMEPLQTYILSVSCRANQRSTFSLSVYHDMNELCLKRAKKLYHTTLPIVNGQWNQESSGGNWLNETYLKNPQYDVTISHATSNLLIILYSEVQNANVNVHLLNSEEHEVGRRLRNLDRGRLVCDEKYVEQLQMLKLTNLEPGNYKMVVSTYEPGVIGNYKLLLAHSDSHEICVAPIPQALGTFEKHLSFEWNNSNRKKFDVSLNHNETEVVFHLRSGGDSSQKAGSYRPAIRASIFDAFTRKPVVVTNTWNDSVHGAFLDCTLKERNRHYVLLVERYEAGSGICRISAGSNYRIMIEDSVEQ